MFDVDVVAFDTRRDQVHLIEGLAAIVFRACDGVTRRRDVVADVADILEMTTEEAERAVAEAIARLTDFGLLQLDHGAPAVRPEGAIGNGPA